MDMSFISAVFVGFLLTVVIVYYLMPERYQWIVLLSASYVFYFAAGIELAIYLLFTTIIVFFAGNMLGRLNQEYHENLKCGKDIDKKRKKQLKNFFNKRKKRIVVVMLFINFGILFVLKYLPVFAEPVGEFLSSFRPDFEIHTFNFLLPLGISFYTFQAMGYIVDLYRDKYQPEKNLAKFALFLSFFPQIIQGPISRYDELAKQLYTPHKFDYKRTKFGVELMLWGYFKKMVIADHLAILTEKVFGNPEQYQGFYLIFTAMLSWVELYADFSGGIDIVIGVAQLFGVTMDENFRQPYFSKSIGEFWRRWHITLGTWMKDYVFYPFCLSKAMNKFGKWGKKHLGDHLGKTLPICLSNLLIFFIVGIWHGAEWRYIMYGMYNGVIIAFSNLAEPLYKKCLHACHIDPHKKWWQCVQILRTFILVNIGWVFDCSAAGMGSAVRMIKRMITDLRFDQLNAGMFNSIGLKPADYIILAAGCIVVLIISILKERGVQIRAAVAAKPIAVRWIIYYGLIVAIFVLGYASDAGSGFLYANF